MYDTVIFDLDGTLLDTIEDLSLAINETLIHFGYPKRTTDEIRKFIGNGARRMLERAMPDDVDEITSKKALKYFKEYYKNNVCINTKPYPEIIVLLEELKKRNINIAIISNKYYTAVNKLNDIFFKEYISYALGESSCVRKKPDPSSIKMLMKLLKSENAVYIGDSLVDLNTAENAGIPCILVSWGYGTHLNEIKDIPVVQTPSEILELI